MFTPKLSTFHNVYWCLPLFIHVSQRLLISIHKYPRFTAFNSVNPNLPTFHHVYCLPVVNFVSPCLPHIYGTPGGSYMVALPKTG